MPQLQYISASQAARKWGISHRRVITLCKENRIPNVAMLGNMWIIPEDANKPRDGRRNRINNKDTRRFKVTIEETVSEDFNVVADSVEAAIESAIEKYEKEEFVLEPGNLEYKQIKAYDIMNDINTEWMDF